ncbi:unnamed protein product [Gordionus sp. m RMFG-2023]
MTITSVRDKPYTIRYMGMDAQILIRRFIICSRHNSDNITCIKETNTLTLMHLNEYIDRMDYYIESKDLWIGIKMGGSNGSLTLNLVQENAPRNISDTGNSTLIINIGATEIFRGIVSVFTYIRNYRIDNKSYIIQHNGLNMNITRI